MTDAEIYAYNADLLCRDRRTPLQKQIDAALAANDRRQLRMNGLDPDCWGPRFLDGKKDWTFGD